MKNKVFCIGFHKTGTTSLEQALEVLGYRVTGPNGTKDPDIADKVLTVADELVARYDAFQDNPWPVIYREMDRKYPGSRFILTMRSADSWIASQVRDFGSRETPMRRWIYGNDAGCPEGNEATYVERYQRHNREVQAHFADRPDDLLIMDLPKGDGWEKLCAFLGEPLPDKPFPHANKASVSRAVKNWIDRI